VSEANGRLKEKHLPQRRKERKEKNFIVESTLRP
jgi:hypothetical protein